MTLLVRDEEDIVDEVLRFHLAQGVDHVIVTDNRSMDGTRDILARHTSEGHVSVIDEPDDDYDQTAWVTRMARLAASEYGADWVINGDADEFWWPKSGDLRSTLAAVPAAFNAIEVDRADFVPTADDTAPFYRRMIVRETLSRNVLGHRLQPKICHRADVDVVIGQGNHDVEFPDLRLQPTPAPIFILHFPLRSYPQFEHKIVVGGRAYERNDKVPWLAGSGWRMRYEDYRAGRLRAFWDGEVLDDEAIRTGIGEGRLTLDRRLQAFFAEASDGPVAGRRVDAAPPAPPPPPARPPVPEQTPAPTWRERVRWARKRARRMAAKTARSIRKA
jgi:hypothetical protein